jgi:hypothetical protein
METTMGITGATGSTMGTMETTGIMARGTESTGDITAANILSIDLLRRLHSGIARDRRLDL